MYQAALIRDALGRFGIEFTNGDEPGVKLTATKARVGVNMDRRQRGEGGRENVGDTDIELINALVAGDRRASRATV